MCLERVTPLHMLSVNHLDELRTGRLALVCSWSAKIVYILYTCVYMYT